ncbi:MAG: ABC-F family ATP-binding cassette domain-containing protein [Deltaproteobacteria bacterium]|nr:ABC-F family ATP-binding cassette domain-containing protein [Deltaproteobacteria bacterium]
MSLVAALNLSLSFLERDLFKDVNFQVEPGDRIGLVGPNGSGKTTLLRLISGEMTPDRGEIRIAKGIRIGYLPQDIHESLQGDLLQAILDSVPDRVRLRREIRDTERALKEQPGKEKGVILAGKLAELHQESADLDLRYPVHRAEKILMGLGFKPEDFPRPLSSLSGGWKMRAALAGLLYLDPECLLLDEPTNHLDLPSVRWLEEFLAGYRGALVLVSHDRHFLNRQVHRILSFEPEGLKSYSGNYDDYLRAREEEKRTLEAKARNQEQKVKEAKKFIERFRSKASKARQAQSKIKLLKKMELVERHKRPKTVHFSFPEVARSGREVLTLDGISKSFGDKTLYRNIQLRVMRGERVAIIGPNGSGKTTLLRMVAGELRPDTGRVRLGHGVHMSYYAQHLTEMLDLRKTVLEEVYQVVPNESVAFVRGVCGAFLFSGNDVDKAVGILSGGEKARVSLAKILVKPGNFLVMDEPTNHLDILSSETLIDALKGFGGTLLFVSHNQSFVERLATKIWDIRDGWIYEYPGTLREYDDHLARVAAGDRESSGANSSESRITPSRPGEAASRKDLRRLRAEKRRMISDTLKPIQERLGNVERRIEELETREKELGTLLADPEIFKDKDKSVPLLGEYGTVKKELEGLLERWEALQEELENARAALGVADGAP